MVAKVDVPGYGPMYFPDSMSDEEIRASLSNQLSAIRPTGIEPSKPRGEVPRISEDEAFNYLQGSGLLQPHHTAGIIGNLFQESGMDPAAVNPKSGAYGMGQWLGPRKQALFDFAEARGVHPSDPYTQMDFLINELRGPESKAYSRLVNANTPEEASVAFRAGYERPGKDEARDEARIKRAQDIFSRYGGAPGGAAGFRIDAKNLPTSEIIKGAFARGVEGTKGTFLDLIPAMGASIFGEDKYARDQLEEYRQRMADIEERNPTAYKSYKEIDDIGSLFDFGAETVGEIGPDVISFMLGTGLGSGIAKTTARKALQSKIDDYAAKYAAEKGISEEAQQELAERLMDRAKAGALGARAGESAAATGQAVGMGAASAALNVPETFNQIYQDTGELHPGVATIFGGVKSALDTIIPGHVMGQLTGAGKDRFTAKVLEKLDLLPSSYTKAFLAEAGVTAAGEGLTEGAQTAIDNMASKYVGAHKDILDNVLDSAIRGAIGGGAFGAPGAAFEAGRYDFTKPEPAAPMGEQGGPAPTGLGVVPQTPYGGPGAAATTPQQADMWGYPYLAEGSMGRPDALLDETTVARPQAPSTVIDEGVLGSMGFGPRAGFYKELVGKDLSVPEDRAAVEKVLERVQSNSKIPRERKEDIKRTLRGLAPEPVQQNISPEFSATQFSASGPDTRYAYDRPQREAKAAADFFNLRARTPGIGVGPELPSGPRAGVPAEGAGVSEAGGMAGDTLSVSGLAGRTADEQRALEAQQIANKQQIRQLEDVGEDRKSTRLNSSHTDISRMPSSA